MVEIMQQDITDSAWNLQLDEIQDNFPFIMKGRL